jgi:hypothetical protein
MMRYRTLGCVLVAAILCTSAHAADILVGISGIRWQSPISAAGNMVETSRDGDVAFFVRPGENHTINHIRLGPVNYGFYRDRLYAAYLEISSFRDFQTLKGYLTEAFGAPETRLQGAETVYSWEHQSINVTLSPAESAGAYRMAYYYVSGSAEPNAERMREQFERHFRSKGGSGPGGEGDDHRGRDGGGRGHGRGETRHGDDQGENHDGEHHGQDRDSGRGDDAGHKR